MSGCEAPLVFLSHELSGAAEDHHQLVRLAGLPAGVTQELLRIGIRVQRESEERERLRPGTYPATFRGEGGSVVGTVRLGLLQDHYIVCTDGDNTGDPRGWNHLGG